MQKIVHKLRQRPHHERRAVAAGVALSSTALLLVGWFAFVLQTNTGGAVQAVVTQTGSNVAAVSATVGPATSSAPVAGPSLVQILTQQQVHGQSFAPGPEAPSPQQTN